MTYVLSDIHGNLENFNSVLEQINLKSDDELYVLGDVIDRHHHGIEILQTIIRTPNMHMILGNHEYMMMDTLGFPYDEGECSKESQEYLSELWYQNGGDVTHKAWKKLTKEEQNEIKEYLLSLPLNRTLEIDGRKFQLVHAAPEDIYDKYGFMLEKFYDSKAHFAVWDRFSVKLLSLYPETTFIFGHTTTDNFQECEPSEIYFNKNIIGIDCGSGWRSKLALGRLACLRLEDMKVFYSNLCEECTEEKISANISV